MTIVDSMKSMQKSSSEKKDEISQTFGKEALTKMLKSGMIGQAYYFILETIGADPVDKETSDAKKQPTTFKILAGFILICIFPAVPMIFVMMILFKIILTFSFITKKL